MYVVCCVVFWGLGLGSWALPLWPWAMGLRSCALGLGAWALGLESWTLDLGLVSWALDLGPWALVPWVLGLGPWVLVLALGSWLYYFFLTNYSFVYQFVYTYFFIIYIYQKGHRKITGFWLFFAVLSGTKARGLRTLYIGISLFVSWLVGLAADLGLGPWALVPWVLGLGA